MKKETEVIYQNFWPEKVIERQERLKEAQLYYILKRIFKYLARYREKE